MFRRCSIKLRVRLATESHAVRVVHVSLAETLDGLDLLGSQKPGDARSRSALRPSGLKAYFTVIAMGTWVRNDRRESEAVQGDSQRSGLLWPLPSHRGHLDAEGGPPRSK